MTARAHPRRAQSPHVVSLRSSRRSVAANRATAAGAALPHADHLVLAARHACHALRQLAAGPAEQLPRAADVSRTRPGIRARGGPRGRDGRLQPVRLLSRAARRAYPVCLRTVAASGAAAVSAHRTADAPLRGVPARAPARARTHDRRPGRHQPAAAARHHVRHPHGAGDPAARADARSRARVLPRLGVAARPAAAAPRPGRAVRLRLSGAAAARREAARRPRRPRQ